MIYESDFYGPYTETEVVLQIICATNNHYPSLHTQFYSISKILKCLAFLMWLISQDPLWQQLF